MELTSRLNRIAEEVPQGAKLADVGTDHAYLPIRLLLDGKISSAMVTDLRKGPLERARANARQFGVSSDISFHLCNGLADIKPEDVDTIVIAGMGGETISAILQAAAWTGEGSRLLLLQPMSSIPELRDWLQENGFVIQREHLAVEGSKYYVLLVVRPGVSPPLSAGERLAGRQWPGMAEPARGAYLDDLERRIQRALAGLESGISSPEHLRKIRELSQAASELREMKKEWSIWQR